MGSSIFAFRKDVLNKKLPDKTAQFLWKSLIQTRIVGFCRKEMVHDFSTKFVLHSGDVVQF